MQLGFVGLGRKSALESSSDIFPRGKEVSQCDLDS